MPAGMLDYPFLIIVHTIPVSVFALIVFVCLAFLCLTHMKYIVISFLVLAISISIHVLFDLVMSYFMIICKKIALFRKKVVREFGAKSSKKSCSVRKW